MEIKDNKNKPLGRKAYGHIPHLSGSRMGSADRKCSPGHERIAIEKTRDCYDLIIIQEKLDGSNCSIAKINNSIIPLTRAGYRAETSPYKQHHYFARWVLNQYKRFNELLNNNERLVGEWLLQAHGTKYNLLHEPFVVFDIMTDMDRLIYHKFLKRIIKFDFVEPRLIHIGQPISLKQIIKRLEPSGHGAIDPVEGAVLRVEREGRVDFLCKYVRPDKEDGKYLIKGENEIWNINLDLL
jgi:ATP-dependent RNA circularization protein (DNA/RNA ligase family)